ncbi:MAG: hypothetical protein J6K75_06480 [Erysipelotrichaceae bacterium]|nr:hypothetical protein [Erysipelotrichaceae bacterium]
MLKDVQSVRVEVLCDSSFVEDEVDIKITIKTPFYTMEAYDSCDKDAVADFAYEHLKDIVVRPQINETGNLMNFLFNKVVSMGSCGMFYYPYLQFVDDCWKKKDINKFKQDFDNYHLNGVIEYDFDDHSGDTIVCYGDFIKHFVCVEFQEELPF